VAAGLVAPGDGPGSGTCEMARQNCWTERRPDKGVAHRERRPQMGRFSNGINWLVRERS
jgi:hypothetical protein